MHSSKSLFVLLLLEPGGEMGRNENLDAAVRMFNSNQVDRNSESCSDGVPLRVLVRARERIFIFGDGRM
jgi:hypothetical protein